jgi:hypothetical protein
MAAADACFAFMRGIWCARCLEVLNLVTKNVLTTNETFGFCERRVGGIHLPRTQIQILRALLSKSANVLLHIAE